MSGEKNADTLCAATITYTLKVSLAEGFMRKKNAFLIQFISNRNS